MGKNWSVALNKTSKGGIEKKKRGRKARAVQPMETVKFKTAQELKGSVLPMDKSRETYPDENEASTSHPDTNTGPSTYCQVIDNDKQVVADQVLLVEKGDMISDVVMGKSSQVYRFDFDPFPPDLKQNLRDGQNVAIKIRTKYVKLNVPVKQKVKSTPQISKGNCFGTTSGLKLYFPGICQTALETVSHSGACTGISALFYKMVTSESVLVEESNLQNLLGIFRKAVYEGTEYWKSNKLPCIVDVKYILGLPLYNSIKIVEHAVWHQTLKLGGYHDASDCVNTVLAKALETQEPFALLVTLPLPVTQTFIVLCRNKTTLMLFDSHVHYTAIPEEQTYYRALERADCQGVVVIGNKRSKTALVQYIFTTMVGELRANPTQGSVICLKCTPDDKVAKN